jgi:hypothetical protein
MISAACQPTPQSGGTLAGSIAKVEAVVPAATGGVGWGGAAHQARLAFMDGLLSDGGAGGPKHVAAAADRGQRQSAPLTTAMEACDGASSSLQDPSTATMRMLLLEEPNARVQAALGAALGSTAPAPDSMLFEPLSPMRESFTVGLGGDGFLSPRCGLAGSQQGMRSAVPRPSGGGALNSLELRRMLSGGSETHGLPGGMMQRLLHSQNASGNGSAGMDAEMLLPRAPELALAAMAATGGAAALPQAMDKSRAGSGNSQVLTVGRGIGFCYHDVARNACHSDCCVSAVVPVGGLSVCGVQVVLRPRVFALIGCWCHLHCFCNLLGVGHHQPPVPAAKVRAEGKLLLLARSRMAPREALASRLPAPRCSALEATPSIDLAAAGLLQASSAAITMTHGPAAAARPWSVRAERPLVAILAAAVVA